MEKAQRKWRHGGRGSHRGAEAQREEEEGGGRDSQPFSLSFILLPLTSYLRALVPL